VYISIRHCIRSLCGQMTLRAGGNVATGRASHAGQVKGDDPDKKRYSSFPGWGMAVRLTPPHHKKCVC